MASFAPGGLGAQPIKQRTDPPTPSQQQRSNDAVITHHGGLDCRGKARPSQPSPVSGRHGPGESLGGGGPDRQLPPAVRPAAGDPRQASCPPSPPTQ